MLYLSAAAAGALKPNCGPPHYDVKPDLPCFQLHHSLARCHRQRLFR
jgi:hypothetical protein